MNTSVKSAISEALEVAFTAKERGHECSINFMSTNDSLEVIYYPNGFCTETAQYFMIFTGSDSCLAPQDPAATIREIMSRIVEDMDQLELEVRGEDF
tara:strand:+ start:47 stop:337 length:291 start_codon:yes stop_codon:yes gene_type:complete